MQSAVRSALETLHAGNRVVERKILDLKEESGRRGPGGQILAGQPTSDAAVDKLAPEVACMANTPGGGALLVGVADDSTIIGTQLDEEWLRGRLYDKLDRRVTVEAYPVEIRGQRILVIVIPEAIEPVRYNHKLNWRVSDRCVEIDASSWHERRRRHLQVDWSSHASTHSAADARAGAVEVARDFLRDSADSSAQELADVPTADLLRRLNAVDGAGMLTNAAALLFVGRAEPGLDYLRRDVAGGDSLARVRRSHRSLLEQLQEVFTTSRAYNPITHVNGGLAQAQVRQIPERALREAIVNGVAHREWAITAPTVVEHVGGLLRVTSPGGFVWGVSPENIINHPSSSRNTALVDLLASLRVAEREGIGIDRMFGDMLRLGYGPPDIAEIDGPSVVTRLIGNHPNTAWIQWLNQLSNPLVRSDLRLLMSVYFAVTNGWLDARVLAPYLQVSEAEATDAITTLVDLTIDGHPVFVEVRGTPAGTPRVMALSEQARTSLTDLERIANIRRSWPTREDIAQAYAAARGRISTTELGDLVGAHATNIGSVLNSLADRGVLEPSRERRRGAGFHYLYVPD
ncbi:hypothetical protein D6T64_12300 [Cryobacterium melibiosiphilum]|uniref:Schlafen AlbA-2 domain-containing protein n=1 Tax=Cryobacterium melibiosiphilum TaxID=995039 RepID=A0A3A5MCL9_9MICO|nr:hypothetical protein D6T64_12300 [Cryobacterium melibiosiphilum]